MEGSGRLQIVQKEPAEKVGPAVTASWRLANPNRPVPVPDQHGGGPGAYADLGLPPAPLPPPDWQLALPVYTEDGRPATIYCPPLGPPAEPELNIYTAPSPGRPW